MNDIDLIDIQMIVEHTIDYVIPNASATAKEAFVGDIMNHVRLDLREREIAESEGK